MTDKTVMDRKILRQIRRLTKGTESWMIIRDYSKRGRKPVINFLRILVSKRLRKSIKISQSF